ncbi:glycoside hydrolase family 13 protein [Butyrivibrio sp. MC2013]|uniref:glycoside hydrolase family 13 protein n=1 Tax=Butyrivibrio sp. MC2013 TaxID=1280686 RepID=UPI00041B281C|nr:glycoside hydrolase family 13 protein [Butyrivibrio sp. MC2013]
MFEEGLLFHDVVSGYLSSVEPEPWQSVTIRFRTGTCQVRSVTLCCEGEEIFMQKVSLSDYPQYCDFYEAEIELSDDPCSYYFAVKPEGGKTLYYDVRGVVKDKPKADSHTLFRIIPGFRVPGWARGAVIYQIFTDRFCNGDKSNDVVSGEYLYEGKLVKKVSDWHKLPDPRSDFRHIYGGDLKGVMSKLDYLSDLGIEVIYFNPLFVSPSSHKYDTQDYDHIDPHFGVIINDGGELVKKADKDNRSAERYIRRTTDLANLEASDRLFAQLVEEAHKRGIRVILDGVFNHCGSFNKWLDTEQIYGNGAYHDKTSPYQAFFKFEEDHWPDNDSYEGWWDYKTLPKLNYEGARALQEYILRIGRKWVSPPYNADGWRLDVAADLGHSADFNHYFWRRFRSAVKEANPSAVIIAENYGSSREWLMGNEWDSVMNYDGFMDPVSWFLTGEDRHSDHFKKDRLCNTELFWSSMKEAMGENFSCQSMQTAMNQLSNHDHSRFMTRTNMRPGRATDAEGSEGADKDTEPAVFMEGALLLMTWPGAPAIYYGDEAGLTGYTDPDNRRTYPWGSEDQNMIAFHKEIIQMRKHAPELRTGALVRLGSMEKGILTYGRFLPGAASVVLINNTGRTRLLDLDLRACEIGSGHTLIKVIETGKEGYNTSPDRILAGEGTTSFRLPPYSGFVYRYEKAIGHGR